MFTNKLFLQDQCEESIKELFEREIPGCKVEDDCVVIFENIKYSIIPLEVMGTKPKNIGFFILCI